VKVCNRSHDTKHYISYHYRNSDHKLTIHYLMR